MTYLLRTGLFLLPLAACFPEFKAATDGNGGSSSGGSSGDGGSSNGGDGSINKVGEDGGPIVVKDGMVRIPKGAFVFRENSSDRGVGASFTHDFMMDVHEVTVGEFKQFVAAGHPTPTCGKPECGVEPSGPYAAPPVWQEAWSTNAKSTSYKEGSCQSISVDPPKIRTFDAGNDQFPINCIPYSQALAYCMWKGKRLPTKMEWQYVATGRDQARSFPWGEQTPSDCTRTTWYGPNATAKCTFPLAVGQLALGVSRDGVLDLAGSVSEWSLDLAGSTSGSPDPAVDFLEAYLGAYSAYTLGGSFMTSSVDSLRANLASGVQARNRSYAYIDVGFRCASTVLP